MESFCKSRIGWLAIATAFAIIAAASAIVRAAEPRQSLRPATIAEQERAFANRFQNFEQAMFRIVDAGSISDQQEIALFRRACDESRRLELVDRSSLVTAQLFRGELYPAIKGQGLLLEDQRRLLGLLQNDRWAKQATILRSWLGRVSDANVSVGRLRHRIAALRRHERWAAAWNWNNKFHLNRVLLIANGPCRENQFLRDQLSGDSRTVVHAILQTAVPGTTQNVHQLLNHFPRTDNELEQYDTVVAFDPDWQSLDAGATGDGRPTAMLNQWVAEESGGLIVVAGSRFTDSIAVDPDLAAIQDLFPVRTVDQNNAYETWHRSPSRVELSRAGSEAEFLRLDNSAAASRQAWANFEGIYGCYPAVHAKPEATVYARANDPDYGRGTELPVFMASRPYGSGRVFYLGSGELWRLRAMGESNFARLYSQIIQFTSRGRLFVEPQPIAMIQHGLIVAMDESCQVYLRSKHPLAFELFNPALDAASHFAAARIANFDVFYEFVKQLRELIRSQEALNVVTQKEQKENLTQLSR